MDKKLGQFYTTNCDYIFTDFEYEIGKIFDKRDDIKTIIEPFAGNGDLKKFIDVINKNIPVEYYDIDPKQDYIVKRDTLLNEPCYNNKFIITNPPYLAKNKTSDKTIFNYYHENDLYKCFIRSILNDDPIGGILIIPLNFWSSITKADIKIRAQFLQTFKIVKLNIFQEKVFDNTSYTICSFIFMKTDSEKNNVFTIPTMLFPQQKQIMLEILDGMIGGEIYNLSNDKKIKIYRLTKLNNNSNCVTNLMIKCIDDDEKICLKKGYYIDDTPKLSSRSYATLIIEPKIDEKMEDILIEKFNEYLQGKREKYHSLFLTNYREGNRKRISFALCFKIINNILMNYQNDFLNEFNNLRITMGESEASIVIQKYVRGYLVRKNILIPSSFYQTYNWRKNQKWYSGGKCNECEKYQINLVQKIININLQKSGFRFNLFTGEFKNHNYPIQNLDALEWSENMDGYFKYKNNKYYVNLKFICGSGGAQTRSLRELYHFINQQIIYLKQHSDIYFINILDGDICYKHIKYFDYLLSKNDMIMGKIFIGDMSEFQLWWVI
jgi:hypothetical protein